MPAANISFDPATHIYHLDGRVFPSVTQVLREAGLVEYFGANEAAKDRGSKAHKALEYLDLGDLDESFLDPALSGYVAGWRRFLEESGAKIEAIEERLSSKRWGYAGTADRIVTLAECKTVLDIKTGTSIHPATGIQLAAYQAALIEVNWPIIARVAVLLPGDGSYRLQRFSDPGDHGVFLAALAVATWKRNHKLESKEG